MGFFFADNLKEGTKTTYLNGFLERKKKSKSY